MKNIIYLFILIITPFTAKSQHFNTITEATNSEWLGEKSLVFVADTPYRVVTGKTADLYTTFAIGSTGKFLELVNKNDIVKGSSMIADAEEFTFDMSGNTITSSTAIFEATDVGKIIYSPYIADMSSALEAFPGYQGTVANYTAYEALTHVDGHLWKVLDVSDDPQAVQNNPNSFNYYFYDASAVQTPFRKLHYLEKRAMTITGFVSSTQVTVDYTSPSNRVSQQGTVGTDNMDVFFSLLQFSIDNDIPLIFDKGGYLFILKQGTSYTINSSTSLFPKVIVEGKGRNETVFYIHEQGDDFSDGTLQTNLNGNTFGGWLDISFSVSTTTYSRLKDFSIIGDQRIPFRGEGKVREAMISFAGVTNSYFDIQNINIESTLSHLYFAGLKGPNIRVENSSFDGLGYAESWARLFGDSYLRANSCNFDRFGAPNFEKARTVAQSGGRLIYSRPKNSFVFTDCRMTNFNGRFIPFFTGEDDAPDTTALVHQRFTNCHVEVNTDASNIICRGVWSGRVSNNFVVSGCTFRNENPATSGNSLTAFGISGGATITNCDFYNCDISFGNSSVGSNNAFLNANEAIIEMQSCKLINTRINLNASATGRVVPVVNVRDSYLSNYAYWGDWHRAISSGSNTAGSAELNFFDCKLTGYGQNVLNGVFVTESASDVDVQINMIRCDVDYQATDGSSTIQLFNGLRYECKINIEDSFFAYPTTIETESSIAGHLTGESNIFTGGLNITGSGNTLVHDLEFNEEIHPNTLTAAANTYPTYLGEGEYDITGTTTIDNLIINPSSNERFWWTGAIRINAVGSDVNISNAGNVSEAVTIQSGGNCILEYDPSTQVFTIVGGYKLL